MATPKILSSFSFLTELTESFRIFLVGSIISIYGLVLYELFPEFLFNPNFSVYYFVIPMLILGIVGIGLPRIWPIILEKIFKKQPVKTPQKTEESDADDILNQIVTEDSSQQLVQQDTSGTMSGDTDKVSIDSLPGTGEKEIEELIASASGPTEKTDDIVGTDSQSLSQGDTMGEDKIRDLIDQKFEPVEKDLSSFKKDLNKIKEDMKVTKESVDTLTESFEGTLTDMKAFQAEISNPLNFMRKYFEAIDLKSLQDPSLPLRQQEKDEAVPTQSGLRDTQTLIVPSQSSSQQSTAGVPTDSPSVSKDAQELKKDDDSKNPMDSVMKPLFSGNLSVGKMMSIIELAGDMLKEQGEDCIDLLVEQCKLMGLKSEDESTIYNIIDMLKNSKMNVEDALIQLYKFAKIVGITDPEAERYYAKLMASRKSDKKSEKGE